MNKFNSEALKAIEDITDEELDLITGAAGNNVNANSSGVICTITHECHVNSFSPSGWMTCC